MHEASVFTDEYTGAADGVSQGVSSRTLTSRRKIAREEKCDPRMILREFTDSNSMVVNKGNPCVFGRNFFLFVTPHQHAKNNVILFRGVSLQQLFFPERHWEQRNPFKGQFASQSDAIRMMTASITCECVTLPKTDVSIALSN